MRIWPLRWTSKGRRAFEQRKNELRYRLSAASVTDNFRVRTLKNGSTVMIRNTNPMINYPYVTEVYMFKPDLSIVTKSYRYASENSSDGKMLTEIIEKKVFQNNSYEPTKISVRSIAK